MIWKQLKKKGQILGFLLKQRDIRFTLGLLRHKIFSEELAFGFKRNLDEAYPKRRALMQIRVRKSLPEDDVFFKDNKTTGLIERMQTPYVAINKDGEPCFRCWVIDASQNEKLQEFWEETFPVLASNEVLIENVFTIPKYRSMGVFPAALSQLADIYKERGVQFALSFGEINNLNTTRAFAYSGFHPYILRRIEWRFFIKSTRFVAIPHYLLEDFKRTTKGIPQPKKLKE